RWMAPTGGRAFNVVIVTANQIEMGQNQETSSTLPSGFSGSPVGAVCGASDAAGTTDGIRSGDAGVDIVFDHPRLRLGGVGPVLHGRPRPQRPAAYAADRSQRHSIG